MIRRGRQKFDIRTQIIFSAFTEFALAAGNSRLQRHTVTDLQMLHARSKLYNFTCTFMAQYKIPLDHEIADPAMLQIVDI
ncbi:hypothetical protein D3C76_1284440 [compost metagenome]